VTLTDIGLGPEQLGPRADLVRGCIGAVTMVYVIGGSMSFTRRFLADDRAVLGPRTLLYKTLVNVPLGTVLFEELAFRGVGLALLSDWLPTWQAVLASSLLFGSGTSCRVWSCTTPTLRWGICSAVGSGAGSSRWC
jgi:membrane protease YdiL (CAAX protease family)